jgi:phage shock protein PspC (stress-responsive transcriptional regulator)
MHDRQIAGVCGGLAEYLNTDPTIVRLVFVALTLLGGPGLLLYIILAIVVPEAPGEKLKHISLDDSDVI